jgi:hypothetical protein
LAAVLMATSWFRDQGKRRTRSGPATQPIPAPPYPRSVNK